MSRIYLHAFDMTVPQYHEICISTLESLALDCIIKPLFHIIQGFSSCGTAN